MVRSEIVPENVESMFFEPMKYDAVPAVVGCVCGPASDPAPVSATMMEYAPGRAAGECH